MAWANEKFAILIECETVRAEIVGAREADAVSGHFSRFPRSQYADDRNREMDAWTATQRQHAIAGRDGNQLREVLDDVRADLDDPSGPDGRPLRGFHTIKVSRIYKRRTLLFAEAARRLQERNGWQITPRTIERIWKDWRRSSNLNTETT